MCVRVCVCALTLFKHLNRYIYRENASFGGKVRHGELNFAINAPGAEKGRIEGLDPVGRQQHFDVAT